MIPCNNVILHDCHKELALANLCYTSINKQECQKVRLFLFLGERKCRRGCMAVKCGLLKYIAQFTA